MEFNTREYEMSHGHTPRGRGSWAFIYFSNKKVSSPEFVPGSVTYGEAKKAARARAKEVGAYMVVVCS